jgi:chorismate-pyruvate lyase
MHCKEGTFNVLVLWVEYLMPAAHGLETCKLAPLHLQLGAVVRVWVRGVCLYVHRHIFAHRGECIFVRAWVRGVCLFVHRDIFVHRGECIFVRALVR